MPLRSIAREIHPWTQPVADNLTNGSTEGLLNPGPYFEKHSTINKDMGINTTDELWKWAGGPGKSLTGGTAVPRGANVVYRSQSDAGHGFTSSLYRLCRENLCRDNPASKVSAAG